jgi:hypothetical protein
MLHFIETSHRINSPGTGKMVARVHCSSSKNWPIGHSDAAMVAALLV